MYSRDLQKAMWSTAFFIISYLLNGIPWGKVSPHPSEARQKWTTILLVHYWDNKTKIYWTLTLGQEKRWWCGPSQVGNHCFLPKSVNMHIFLIPGLQRLPGDHNGSFGFLPTRRPVAADFCYYTWAQAGLSWAGLGGLSHWWSSQRFRAESSVVGYEGSALITGPPTFCL